MRDLAPDDLPKGEPPRVSPGIRPLLADPCGRCGGSKLRLEGLAQHGEIDGTSGYFRFEPDVEAAVLETGEIPPLTWLSTTPDESWAVEPGALTVAHVMCSTCGNVERRAGYQVADVIG